MVCNYLAAAENGTLEKQDLHFTTPNTNVSPLPSNVCHQILQKYFFEDIENISFTILNIFLNFMSNQLVKFSLSQFFTVENLKAMGAKPSIRNELVMALLRVAKDFSTRSAGVSLKKQVLETFNN